MNKMNFQLCLRLLLANKALNPRSFLIFTLHLHLPKPMNFKRILCCESVRKVDIIMRIASVANSKYQDMEEFLSALTLLFSPDISRVILFYYFMLRV